MPGLVPTICAGLDTSGVLRAVRRLRPRSGSSVAKAEEAAGEAAALAAAEGGGCPPPGG